MDHNKWLRDRVWKKTLEGTRECGTLLCPSSALPLHYRAQALLWPSTAQTRGGGGKGGGGGALWAFTFCMSTVLVNVACRIFHTVMQQQHKVLCLLPFLMLSLWATFGSADQALSWLQAMNPFMPAIVVVGGAGWGAR